MPGSVIVHPSRVSGTVAAPGSKSAAQRAIACAVLAEGTTVLWGVPRCDDVDAAFRMARGLGCHVARDGDCVTIAPGRPTQPVTLHAGESGLAFRVFCAVAARFDVPVRLEAAGSLAHRPMDMIPGALQQLGVPCTAHGGRAPVEVTGPITGGRVVVDGRRTSQFVSGLLIALSGCPNPGEIHAPGLVSRPYVEMTVSVLEQFGASVSVSGDGDTFLIPGGQRTTGIEVTVPGDWSGAAPLLVAGAIAGAVTVSGLDLRAPQADRAILEALDRCGARVAVYGNGVTVTQGHLRGFQMDLTSCPDLAPVLAVLASCSEGTSMLTGTARLAIKESDRAVELARLIRGLGGMVTVEADHMVIEGGRLTGGNVDSAGDHRIAMAGALAGLVADGPVQVTGAEAVSKSYPGFFRDLAALGAHVEREMRVLNREKGDG